MKSQKSFLVLLILLLNCQILLTQEKNENLVLFDSVSSQVTYEDLIARIDFLTFEKDKNPNAVAYIVIYGGSNQIENAFYKKTIARYIKFRGDEEKLKVITSTNSEKAKIEFWISKNGTQPKVKQENNSLFLPTANKAVYFADELIEIVEIEGKQTYYFVGCEVGCIKFPDFYLLSEFLKENPGLKAFVVIRNKNQKKATLVKNVLSKKILNDTEISSSRLNFLYGSKNKTNNNRFSEIEVYLAIDKTQLPKSSSIKYKPF